MIFSALFTFSIIAIIFVAIYLYLSRNFDYWKVRGIKGPEPVIGFGNVWQLFFEPIPVYFNNCREKYGKVFGMFVGSKPSLVIADPELIKIINIRDFNNFRDRDDFIYDSFFARFIFNLKGDSWKKLRSIVTPTFSNNKLRKMHPLVVDGVKRLEKALDKRAVRGGNNEISAKKFMGRLTMDLVSRCAFGTEIDAYTDENNYEINADKMLHQVIGRSLVFLLVSTMSPRLLKWTDYRLLDPEACNFFVSMSKAIILKRKTEKPEYNDYMQLLINAESKATEINDHGSENENKDTISSTDQIQNSPENYEVTEEDIIANAYILFMAGYNTAAVHLAHLMYSLAVNEKCQQKLYEEVKQFNGVFDYESLTKMPYLEACIAETLRMYSPLPFVNRIAAEDYALENTGITIPKGMIVVMNIQGMHYNPDYYPNPNTWDPERFLIANQDKLTPGTFLPFGCGPRGCFGYKFAALETKLTFAHLVSRYRFFKTDKTQIPLVPKKMALDLDTGELNIGIELRNTE